MSLELVLGALVLGALVGLGIIWLPLLVPFAFLLKAAGSSTVGRFLRLILGGQCELVLERVGELETDSPEWKLARRILAISYGVLFVTSLCAIAGIVACVWDRLALGT